MQMNKVQRVLRKLAFDGLNMYGADAPEMVSLPTQDPMYKHVEKRNEEQRTGYRPTPEEQGRRAALAEANKSLGETFTNPQTYKDWAHDVGAWGARTALRAPSALFHIPGGLITLAGTGYDLARNGISGWYNAIKGTPENYKATWSGTETMAKNPFTRAGNFIDRHLVHRFGPQYSQRLQESGGAPFMEGLSEAEAAVGVSAAAAAGTKALMGRAKPGKIKIDFHDHPAKERLRNLDKKLKHSADRSQMRSIGLNPDEFEITSYVRKGAWNELSPGAKHPFTKPNTFVRGASKTYTPATTDTPFNTAMWAAPAEAPAGAEYFINQGRPIVFGDIRAAQMRKGAPIITIDEKLYPSARARLERFARMTKRPDLLNEGEWTSSAEARVFQHNAQARYSVNSAMRGNYFGKDGSPVYRPTYPSLKQPFGGSSGLAYEVVLEDPTPRTFDTFIPDPHGQYKYLKPVYTRIGESPRVIGKMPTPWGVLERHPIAEATAGTVSSEQK